MRTLKSELTGKAVRRFMLAALLMAAWFGLHFWFPTLASTGIPNTAARVIINGAILIGLWRGLSRTDFPVGTRVAVWLAIAVPFTLWTALVWGLAAHGVFEVNRGVARIPYLPVAIILPVPVGLFLLLRSKRIVSLLDVMPPTWLIGLQVYRVLGASFLVNWLRGGVPGVFALPAGSGDVMVGLLALPAALWVSSGTQSGRKVGVWWNRLGFVDFSVAILMGVLSSPGPLQVFARNFPNTQFGTFPSVLIPAFAVPSSILLHALSLLQLSRLGRKATNATSPVNY